MAKGRKPAIDGLARPQGFLDDVVYPIAQKAARAVMSKTLKAGEPSLREKAYWAAAKAERAVTNKRVKSYSDTARKAFKGKKYGKMETAIKKAQAANNPNASVRKAAKAQRGRNRMERKIR